MIAASLVVFGLLICLLAKLPPRSATLIVGLFAAFHGYAHGAEIPDGAGPLQYGAGFVLATAGLLAAGTVTGLAGRLLVPTVVFRAAGMAVAVFGLVMMAGQLG
jgi:urease accessory protein